MRGEAEASAEAVAARHDRGPRGGAARVRVSALEDHACVGESIEGRRRGCVRVHVVRGELVDTDIIHDEDQHVVRGWPRRRVDTCVGLGAAQVAAIDLVGSQRIGWQSIGRGVHRTGSHREGAQRRQEPHEGFLRKIRFGTLTAPNGEFASGGVPCRQGRCKQGTGWVDSISVMTTGWPGGTCPMARMSGHVTYVTSTCVRRRTFTLFHIFWIRFMAFQFQ